jgi:predicted transposase YbfD/YdcC
MPPRKPAAPSVLSLIDAFSIIPDPRSDRNRRHPLINIVVIAACGVLAGADNWVAIEEWAAAKDEWLGSFLDMSEGVPSHDTFGRVFSILSPAAFQQAFIAWARSLEVDVAGRVIAVDGKTSRRSHDRNRDRGPIHVVNAWCTAVGVSLGQRATEEKSNEITAIPELLDQLYLKGAIVTLDAMGCQREIASKIRSKEAHYILAVKGNQLSLSAALESAFDTMFAEEDPPPEMRVCSESENTHGRQVTRTAWVLPAPAALREQNLWADLASIVCVESGRTEGGKESFERRLYISSMAATSAPPLARAIREHWGVENGLHWVLDVAFREDESRIRIGHAAENMARLRQIALNLLKRETTRKVGIKTKRLRAGWDDGYMMKLLRLAGRPQEAGDV